MKKGFFSIPQRTIWGIALGEACWKSMNNKFIINNGVSLHNTKNKKTKVEILIEELKQQEQAINKEWDNCQINYSVTADSQAPEISQ